MLGSQWETPQEFHAKLAKHAKEIRSILVWIKSKLSPHKPFGDLVIGFFRLPLRSLRALRETLEGFPIAIPA